MLLIRDVPDLLDYLKFRRQMAQNQCKPVVPGQTKVLTQCERRGITHASGMVYAYDQAIEAVEALLSNETLGTTTVND